MDDKYHDKIKYLLLLLIFIPFITEYIETGKVIDDLRGLVTEITMSLILSFLLIRIFRQIKLLERLSLIDKLTGIGNRRQFDIDLEREINRKGRIGKELILVFFDLNRFKYVNDTFGHAAGDFVLKEFGKKLSSFIRRGLDSCYRFGGDEFAILITNIENKEIEKIKKRISNELRIAAIVKNKIRVTSSASLVIHKEDENIAAFLKRADGELYESKKKNV